MNDAFTYYYRGVVYLIRGNETLAIQDLQKVLELPASPAMRKEAEELLKALGAR